MKLLYADYLRNHETRCADRGTARSSRDSFHCQVSSQELTAALYAISSAAAAKHGRAGQDSAELPTSGLKPRLALSEESA